MFEVCQDTKSKLCRFLRYFSKLDEDINYKTLENLTIKEINENYQNFFTHHSTWMLLKNTN